MPRSPVGNFVVGEEVIFNITFYSDAQRETEIDPASVVLKVESPGGVVSTPTTSQDGSRPLNTGKYTASKIVDQYGIWNWRWETTSPTIVKQGSILVESNLI